MTSLALGGCGGGGGGINPAPPPPVAINPPPVPLPPPPPPPAPPPPTSGFNDAEYAASNAAVAANAIGAYDAGATGKGVKIGVVDYGTINPDMPEFLGRLDPASGDLVGSGRFNTSSHGTWVASVAAANRNGSSIQGVAFDAKLISMDVSEIGCSAQACSTNFPAMIRAIDTAVENGARVINFSAGPGPFWKPEEYVAAMRRAAEAGVVLVFAAGNNGASSPTVNVTLVAKELTSFGNVIVAGAHNAARQISSASDRAGDVTSYLTALGVGVAAVGPSGVVQNVSGTSFSAPAIAGAVALLASAFPSLKPNELVDILFKSADDAGATGWDSIYGHGILNVGRAFQPIGAAKLAGTGTPISLSANGRSSSTMGDANLAGGAEAVILDGYSRPYTLNLGRTLSIAAPDRPLAQSLHGSFQTTGVAVGPAALSITFSRRLDGRFTAGLTAMPNRQEKSQEVRAVAGSAVTRIAPGTLAALGVSKSGGDLQQQMTGRAQNAFLVASDPLSRSGFHAAPSGSVGLRHMLGDLGMGVTGERGRVWGGGLDGPPRDLRYKIGSVSADRTFGPVTFSLGASRLDEESTILGGSFDPALAAGGARTYFLDGSAALELGSGWSLYGSYRRGRSTLPGTGGLAHGGRLWTDSWAVDVTKNNAFRGGDRLALRLMQPLRVRAGGLNMLLPATYDYLAGRVGYQPRFLNLAPGGRELDVEAAYSLNVLGVNLGLSLYYRSDPGHIEAARSDSGGAIRFSFGF